MKAIKAATFILIICVATVSAQEDPQPILAPAAPEAVTQIKVQEMENLTIAALRKEFPRLSGVFASVHSCRLPEYGPMISITIQLPAYYFTRPVLQELDRRQRAAEEQARKVRIQLERASQVITLRAKEANLMDRIEWETSTKKKSKEMMEDLQAQLTDVRKSLQDLESEQPALLVIQDNPHLLNEVDLNKMLNLNYQQLVERVSKAMKNSLAENAPKLSDLSEDERVTLNAYIRDSIVGSPGKSMLFILHQKDILEYKTGAIDLNALRERVLVHDTPRE